MARIRAEREKLGWTRMEMAKKLRDAAVSPRDVPCLNHLMHNIYRWERGEGMSERYRILYCRAFNRTEQELFGLTSKPAHVTDSAPPFIPIAGLPFNSAGDTAYVVVVLPRGSQRVLIDVSDTTTISAPSQESAQVPPLILVRNTDAANRETPA